jgi:hypothetical protein
MNPEESGLLQLPSSPQLEERVSKLESDLAIVCWLYAEMIYKLRLTAAQQLVEKIQPELEKALLAQIMNGASSNPG